MYAIIDIGSNTIRLNVYQVEEDGAIHSIFQSKETAGLAGYVQEDGSMSREGLDRAADALLRFRSILDALHIENRAVFATASLRNITNSEEAVFQLQERTGLMIRLLSGREEAILDYVGATSGMEEREQGMVLDIGGGSTDIAVISMGGRVKAASLPVAGNAFDSCIAQYVQEKYQIAIGPLTAEQLKKQVACCTRSEFEGVMEVRGHSWETNLPARRIIYTRDLYEPVQELAARIANAARNVLESTPPELAADVSGTGILLTGGGSLLRGLAGYIAGELHTDVAIAPDPLNCVARGTAISLSEGKYLSAGFRDATPKVWNRRLNHSHDPFTGE